jgi:hypothetical protein
VESSPSSTRVEREYFPNGQLRRETPYVDGKVTGVVRFWYDDGVLRQELPQVEGVFHGKMRQWNKDGLLKDECEFDHGSGCSRSYFPNGRLESETFVRDNNFVYGPLRMWNEQGELLVEQFFLGVRVSKKRYLEACLKDPSLPRYDGKNAPVSLMEQLAEPAAEHHLISLDEYPDARDAMDWLTAPADFERRVGELPSTEDSMEFVSEFLKEGAKRVLVVNIQVDDDGSENTGELVVELPAPRATKKRRKVMEACNKQNESLGFAGIEDSGQKYVHIALD